jgi:hypothetical protein
MGIEGYLAEAHSAHDRAGRRQSARGGARDGYRLVIHVGLQQLGGHSLARRNDLCGFYVTAKETKTK